MTTCWTKAITNCQKYNSNISKCNFYLHTAHRSNAIVSMFLTSFLTTFSSANIDSNVTLPSLVLKSYRYQKKFETCNGWLDDLSTERHTRGLCTIKYITFFETRKRQQHTHTLEWGLESLLFGWRFCSFIVVIAYSIYLIIKWRKLWTSHEVRTYILQRKGWEFIWLRRET